MSQSDEDKADVEVERNDLGEHSVTAWLQQLPEGDSYAQAMIWERYAEQVVRMARRFLGGVQRRDSDEEDVAVQVLNNLYQKMAGGKFDDVKNRKQLWALLLGMTRNKAAEAARKTTAKKRGEGRVLGESVFIGGNDTNFGIDQVANDEPTPESRFFQSEQFVEMIDMLGTDEYRQIVLLRMAGYSNEEIGQIIACSERTVERKFEKIRGILRVDG